MSNSTTIVGDALMEAAITMGKYHDKIILLGCSEAHGIVARYGGAENTQAAAILMMMTPEKVSTDEEVREKYGEGVARLYSRVGVGYGFNRHTYRRDIIEIAEKCCQGVAAVILAVECVRWNLRLYPIDKFDPNEVGMRRYDDRLVDYVFELIAAFLRNERVASNAEYPELRTTDMVEYLQMIVYKALSQ